MSGDDTEAYRHFDRRQGRPGTSGGRNTGDASFESGPSRREPTIGGPAVSTIPIKKSKRFAKNSTRESRRHVADVEIIAFLQPRFAFCAHFCATE